MQALIDERNDALSQIPAQAMQTARAAGIKAVGVTWGFRSREELKEGGADVIMDSPEQILELL